MTESVTFTLSTSLISIATESPSFTMYEMFMFEMDTSLSPTVTNGPKFIVEVKVNPSKLTSVESMTNAMSFNTAS